MAYKIEKLDLDKSNNESRYRLVNSNFGFDVVFSRDTFRSKLEDLGLSTKSIGSVLKILNKLYPPEMNHLKIEKVERYNDDELIKFLTSFGYVVKKRYKALDVLKAIKILEERGYEVEESNRGVSCWTQELYKN